MSSLKIVSQGHTMLIKVNKAQLVTLEAYLPNGKLIHGMSFTKFLGVGEHAIPVNGAHSGNLPVIFRVRGETFLTTEKVLMLK
jgi:hypothetical protein